MKTSGDYIQILLIRKVLIFDLSHVPFSNNYVEIAATSYPSRRRRRRRRKKRRRKRRRRRRRKKKERERGGER